MMLSKALVAAIRRRKPSGRFLEVVDKQTYNSWREIDPIRALTKTSQGLRDSKPEKFAKRAEIWKQEKKDPKEEGAEKKEEGNDKKKRARPSKSTKALIAHQPPLAPKPTVDKAAVDKPSASSRKPSAAQKVPSKRGRHKAPKASSQPVAGRKSVPTAAAAASTPKSTSAAVTAPTQQTPPVANQPSFSGSAPTLPHQFFLPNPLGRGMTPHIPPALHAALVLSGQVPPPPGFLQMISPTNLRQSTGLVPFQPFAGTTGLQPPPSGTLSVQESPSAASAKRKASDASGGDDVVMDTDHIEAAQAILGLGGADKKRPRLHSAAAPVPSQDPPAQPIPEIRRPPSPLPLQISNPKLIETVPAIGRLIKQKEMAHDYPAHPLIVQCPEDNDVRLGRGGSTAKHPGNVWYRTLVNRYRQLYKDSKKFQKMLVSKAIVFAVIYRDPPGRFLEMHPDTHWHIVPYHRAVNKVSQALREKVVPGPASTEPTALRTNFATVILNRLDELQKGSPKIYPLHRYLWTTNTQANLVCVKDFLRNDPQVAETPDHDVNLPIHVACAASSPLNIVQVLIDDRQHTLEAKNKFGWLPLHVACANGASLAVIQKVFDGFPMAICQPAGESRWWLPLHVTCASGAELNVIKFLVKKHPKSIGLYDASQKLPIHLARENGASSEVMTFLEAETARSDILPSVASRGPPR
jgi:hypothetical protein